MTLTSSRIVERRSILDKARIARSSVIGGTISEETVYSRSRTLTSADEVNLNTSCIAYAAVDHW